MTNIPRGQMPFIGSRYNTTPRTVRHPDGAFEQFNMHSSADDVWQRALLAQERKFGQRGLFWVGYSFFLLAAVSAVLFGWLT